MSRAPGRYRWLFVVEGIVFVSGVVGIILGETVRGLVFAVLALVGMWQAWFVMGGPRVRPSPRFAFMTKHGPLLAILFLASIWIVAVGIGYLTSGEPGQGWWRIAFALLLAIAFLFVLRRALRDHG
jgi:hypothetical protein